MNDLTRIERLLRMVDLLSSGREFNAPQLAELCGISRRTVFRDITALQEFGIHVKYDAGRQTYRLTSRQFLPPAELTLDETLALVLLGAEMGSQGTGVLFGPIVRNAALKLASNLPRKLRDQVQEVTKAIQIQLDPSSPETASAEQNVFEKLQQAIAEKKSLRIRYQSLTEWDEIQTRLNPYRLLFSRRNWYVIGRSSLHRAVRTFKISRIHEVEILDVTYEIPPRFSLERYLGNAWHLIRESKQRFDVVVRFSRTVSQNVAEVRWHRTQKVTWEDNGSCLFQVTVDGLQEVSWWILGYGDQAEVLQPLELRQIIVGRVKRMAAIYDDKSSPTEI